MALPSARASALLVLVLLAPAEPAAAQGPPPARDSARALRGARAAQADFERLRFRHLPWTQDGGSGGPCDERIGRFCFWHNDDEEDWSPPPEEERVRTGRERLLARLAEAAAVAPGDEWVAGQRVRYLLEAHRAEEAVAAAEACRSRGWWCAALVGYARHEAGDFARAEAAFETALGGMPEEERREWTDLSRLLAPGQEGAYRRLRGAARDSLERRFWWLADPLWSVPGNDRRTEHLSRWVTDRLQDRAATTEGWVWGDDLREILLRYGSPTGWERVRSWGYASAGTRPSVIAHYAPRSREFLPPLGAAREPATLRAGDYRLEDEKPRTSYAPAYAKDFRAAEHQVAVFRRGERGVVVAAWDLDADSVPAATPVEAALVLARGPSSEPEIARAALAGATGTLRAEAAPGPLFVSLEVRARADGADRIGWARMAVEVPPPPASGIALSDVLLLRPAEALPETLEEAVAVARGSARVKAGERIGLFWEVYRTPRGAGETPDTLSVSVSVAREGEPGLARRLGQALGVAGRDRAVRVTWKQEADGLPVLPRALAVAIPDLRPGEYTLRVSVRQGEGEEVAAERRVRVVR